MKIILILTSAFFVSYSFANDRVQNGWQIPAENSLARSIAKLQTPSGSCTATFISKTFLLTAAHCTYRSSASTAKILVRNSSGQWLSTSVKRLITHPRFQIQPTDFSGTFVRNDIALIEIASAFPFPISPIVIGSVNEYLYQETQARIYGYGKSSSAGGTGILRWGLMNAIVDSVALFYGDKGLEMTPEVDQALCQGDSGGPVMKIVGSRRYLIGVNSLSNGCKNVLQVTSKAVIASSYFSWIRQYVSGI